MDWVRNTLIVSIAVFGWLLVYQWQQDYGASGQQHRAAESRISDNSSQSISLGEDGERILATDLPTFDVNAPGLVDQGVDTGENVFEDALAPAAARGDQGLVRVSTPLMNLKIDPVGADVVHSSLLKYPISVNQPDQPFTLHQSKPGQRYIAESGMVGVTGRDLDYEAGARPVYQVPSTSYDMGDSAYLSVPFTYVHENGLTFTKIYEFARDSYQVNVTFEIHNRSPAPWLGRVYGRLVRNGYQDPTQSSGFGMSTFLGGAYLDERARFKKISFSDIEDAKSQSGAALNQSIEGGWVALIQHYFLSAWVPSDNQQNTYRMFSRSGVDGFEAYVLEVAYPVLRVEPGAVDKQSISLYLGPKIQSELKETAAGLHLAVDYGYLFFISDALFRFLKFIYSLVGNWGWSIILLTFFVKVLLYPLSAKSYRSMAQMRKVQPKLLALRERYGDDKQKMSQELMKLYQREKINPLGGCWPMLVQMPIFIALYWALLESVELRQAPFLLWIQDLSVMDPYFVLPLLMGVSMWFQQKMLPDPPDPTQAKIMKLMPVFMTFLFLFFPSGLVLYWVTNNILSICQQWFNTRQQEQLTTVKHT